MSLTLPPLNALRAFESAARNGGYMAAASELGVSAAAISQQVRKLEQYLGKQLFQRLNNRVVLTDAGQTLFDGAATALQALSDTTRQMVTERSRSRLVISAIESIAERWLLPRLARYALANPDFRFDLRVEPDPVDFGRHDLDLRIGYGPVQNTELSVLLQIPDSVVPMCSPAYLARHPRISTEGPGAVPETDLLHTDWGADFGSNPTWAVWFAKAGLPPRPLGFGFQTSRSSLLIDMARAGLGVALGQRMMAQDDLLSGRLVTLSDIAIPLGHTYFLACPRSKARKRAVLALVGALSEGHVKDAAG
jgi:LysR family transcriptional regulator, glycine cleavage system transcriptional activator